MHHSWIKPDHDWGQTCRHCGLKRSRAPYAWDWTLTHPDGTVRRHIQRMPECAISLSCAGDLDPCHNKVTHFIRGDYYCRKHAMDLLRLA